MILRLVLAVLVAFSLVGCSSGTDTVAPVNQGPSISFDFNKIAVSRASSVLLSVAVSDPNADDQLSTTWSITRGSLSGTSTTSRTWSVPATAGTDTLEVVVTDGQRSAKITEVIRVATRTTGVIAQGIYTKANSPYIIAPSVTPPNLEVSNGASSNVEAGVELFIDEVGTSLSVLGTLNLNGTSSEPVVIAPNDRTLLCGTGTGWWDGIIVEGTGALNATYAQISYGENNIRVREQGTINVDNVILQCSQEAGLLMEGTGSATITNSEISNSAANGIDIRAISSVPTGVQIQGCAIEFNQVAGILININDPLVTAALSITQNEIVNNFSSGIFLGGASRPSISQNHIAVNGGSGTLANLRLDTDFAGGSGDTSIDVSNNFWGSTTLTNIINNIDNNSSLTLVVEPFLTTSPIP